MGIYTRPGRRTGLGVFFGIGSVLLFAPILIVIAGVALMLILLAVLIVAILWCAWMIWGTVESLQQHDATAWTKRMRQFYADVLGWRIESPLSTGAKPTPTPTDTAPRRQAQYSNRR